MPGAPNLSDAPNVSNAPGVLTAVGDQVSGLKRLTLPRYTFAETEALNIIARHGADCYWPILNSDDSQLAPRAHWRISLTHTTSQASSILRGHCNRIAIFDWSGSRFHLLFNAQAGQVWTASRFGSQYVATQTDESASAALLEAMLVDAMQAMALSGLGIPRLQSLMPIESSPLSSVMPSYARLPHLFSLTLQPLDSDADEAYAELVSDDQDVTTLDGPHATESGTAAHMPLTFALLEADAFAMTLIAGLLADASDTSDVTELNRLDSLAVTLCLGIGETRLVLSEFQDLALGDVLFCESLMVQGGDADVLDNSVIHAYEPGGRSWRMRLCNARIDGNDGNDGNGEPPTLGATDERSTIGPCLILLAQDELVTNAPENELTAAPSQESLPSLAGSLDAMPVTIGFNLGTLTLPLAQLRELTPGQALPLARALNGPVNITANGVAIGRGDLVEIDGLIGIVITHLSRP